jgi:hypothetical protein
MSFCLSYSAFGEDLRYVRSVGPSMVPEATIEDRRQRVSHTRPLSILPDLEQNYLLSKDPN